MNSMVTSTGIHSAELTVSIQMKNGDVIRLHQTQAMEGIMTHHFTSGDTPLNTVSDLEVLLARLDEMVGPEDKVYIHLPPVTYTEELFVSGRAINFIGSTDEAGNRTAFTAPIRVESERGWVFFLEGFDLLGSGEGTGLSAAARVHLTDCRIAGWETGVLAHTSAWVNADECVFEDNAAGFCFDATRGTPSDSRYVNNLFQNNGTAGMETELVIKRQGLAHLLQANLCLLLFTVEQILRAAHQLTRPAQKPGEDPAAAIQISPHPVPARGVPRPYPHSQAY